MPGAKYTNLHSRPGHSMPHPLRCHMLSRWNGRTNVHEKERRHQACKAPMYFYIGWKCFMYISAIQDYYSCPLCKEFVKNHQKGHVTDVKVFNMCSSCDFKFEQARKVCSSTLLTYVQQNYLASGHVILTGSSHAVCIYNWNLLRMEFKILYSFISTEVELQMFTLEVTWWSWADL